MDGGDDVPVEQQDGTAVSAKVNICWIAGKKKEKRDESVCSGGRILSRKFCLGGKL